MSLEFLSRQLSKSDNTAISMYLRDTFAHVQAFSYSDAALYYKVPETLSDEYAVELFNQGVSNGTKLFLSGKHIFAHITESVINSEGFVDFIASINVSLIIPGLRQIYWNNRSIMTRDDVKHLELVMGTKTPTFVNIFDFPSLQEYADVYVPAYTTESNITEFDYVQVSVFDFMRFIKEKKPITVKILNTEIELHYNFEELAVNSWNIKYSAER